MKLRYARKTTCSMRFLRVKSTPMSTPNGIERATETRLMRSVTPSPTSSRLMVAPCRRNSALIGKPPLDRASHCADGKENDGIGHYQQKERFDGVVALADDVLWRMACRRVRPRTCALSCWMGGTATRAARNASAM